MKIKLNKEIDPAQLTEELLPIGVNSVNYDASKKELEVNSILDGFNPTDSEIQSVVSLHKPVAVKTRQEILKSVKDADDFQKLKQALLELYGVK